MLLFAFWMCTSGAQILLKPWELFQKFLVSGDLKVPRKGPTNMRNPRKKNIVALHLTPGFVHPCLMPVCIPVILVHAR